MLPMMITVINYLTLTGKHTARPQPPTHICVTRSHVRDRDFSFLKIGTHTQWKRSNQIHKIIGKTGK